MLCELETFQLNDDNRRKSPQVPAFRFHSKVLALGAVGFRDLLLLRKSAKTVLEGDATSVLSLLLRVVIARCVVLDINGSSRLDTDQ
jgi:hypothetical protein